MPPSPSRATRRPTNQAPGITPETTIWYYDSVLNKMGKSQSDWMRLFMAPGMGIAGEARE